MRIFIDVETIPSTAPDAREIARQGVKPPGNLKRQDSVAAWWAEQGEAAVEEAYRRQALDATLGEICGVGLGLDDGDPVSLVRGLDEAEAGFLRRAMDAIAALLKGETTSSGWPVWGAQPYFVGHNAVFDLTFLWRRCVVHGIRPPFRLPGPTARAGRDFGCTMVAWAGPRETISLDRLCRALGVPSPKAGGVDGSKVFDLWRAGEHETIRQYNIADVSAVRECWHRLNFESALEEPAHV